MTVEAVAADEIAQLAQNVARNCGYAVFPCRENKAPATEHGFLDATSDPEAVPGLWRRFPGPLVGVATGEASGISVLDVDVKADEALAWWRQNEIRLPTTRTYRTRSGGLHLVFQHAPGVRNAQGKPTPGVDSRGTGGFVVWWFAHGLECLDHAPPAPWPHWLMGYFWPPKPAASTRATPSSASTSDKALDGIVRTVRDAQEGSRNGVLFWAAKRMQERQVAPGEARRLLTSAATDAGLDKTEIARTLASAWRSA